MRNGEFPPVLSVGLGERQNPISKLDYHIVWGSGSTVPASSDGHRDFQSHKRFSRIYTRAARWRRSWNGQFCNEEAKSACYAKFFHPLSHLDQHSFAGSGWGHGSPVFLCTVLFWWCLKYPAWPCTKPGKKCAGGGTLFTLHPPAQIDFLSETWKRW